MSILDSFEICEESPSGLVWAVDIFNSLGRQTKIRKGMVAGSQNADGYYVVELNGVSIYTHRIIWEKHNGQLVPEGWIVDHEDGRPNNNTPLNLTAKPNELNARNTKVRSTNTSGTNGVDFYSNGKYDYVRTRWTENGKQRNKCFRVDVYGRDQAYQMAVQTRIDAITRMNSCGAGYTERHGK